MSVRLPALLAAALVVTAAGSSPVRALDAATSDRPIVAAFAGERLDYDVTFLFFRRAAVGQISLEAESAPGPDGRGGPGSGRYVARLFARTKGFVGWLDRRRHAYTSILVPCEGGTRWCSRVFVKDLAERDGREVTTTFVNRARGVMTWTVRRGAEVEEIGRDPVPPGARFDDMLVALLNFRAGVYGPAEKGRRYDLDMMPVEGVRTFTLRVLEGEAERETRRKFGMGESGLVIAVELPRAIFRNEGEVFVWFSPDMVPLGAAVENYIGWGDVTGHLVRALRPAGARPVRAEDLEETHRARRRADPGETPRPLGFDRDR